MRAVHAVSFVVLLLVSRVPIFAQPPVEFEGNLHTCTVVASTSNVVCSAHASFPLYSGPPRPIPFLPFFLLSPDEAGTVQEGTEFSIGDRQTVDLLGERSRWLLLQTADGSQVLGWSYAGSAEGLSDTQIAPQAGP